MAELILLSVTLPISPLVFSCLHCAVCWNVAMSRVECARTLECVYLCVVLGLRLTRLSCGIARRYPLQRIHCRALERWLTLCACLCVFTCSAMVSVSVFHCDRCTSLETALRVMTNWCLNHRPIRCTTWYVLGVGHTLYCLTSLVANPNIGHSPFNLSSLWPSTHLLSSAHTPIPSFPLLPSGPSRSSLFEF